jgi:hypothetical protein
METQNNTATTMSTYKKVICWLLNKEHIKTVLLILFFIFAIYIVYQNYFYKPVDKSGLIPLPDKYIQNDNYVTILFMDKTESYILVRCNGKIAISPRMIKDTLR